MEFLSENFFFCFSIKIWIWQTGELVRGVCSMMINVFLTVHDHIMWIVDCFLNSDRHCWTVVATRISQIHADRCTWIMRAMQTMLLSTRKSSLFVCLLFLFFLHRSTKTQWCLTIWMTHTRVRVRQNYCWPVLWFAIFAPFEFLYTWQHFIMMVAIDWSLIHCVFVCGAHKYRIFVERNKWKWYE